MPIIMPKPVLMLIHRLIWCWYQIGPIGDADIPCQLLLMLMLSQIFQQLLRGALKTNFWLKLGFCPNQLDPVDTDVVADAQCQQMPAPPSPPSPPSFSGQFMVMDALCHAQVPQSFNIEEGKEVTK